MSWAALFRAREYLKDSFWFYPLIGAILGPLVALLTQQADTSVTVPPAWQYAPSTASTVLTTIVGATVGLTGFVVTVTVLAIQMATGTFSARVMRIWYRNRMLKATLTVLAGTLTFSFSLLRQVGSKQVPDIGVSVAGILLGLSLVLFLLFFDRFIHGLRPVAVAHFASQMARRVITTVTQAAEVDAASAQIATGQPVLMVPSRRDGSIQAVDVHGLVRWAGRHLLAMQAAVGDFVTTGEHIIAVKALSAAINDPTTAVQALNHLGNVLRLLGSTPLHGPLAFRDQEGTPRLLTPGRTWEDYLTLAVTEIREYRASSIQVMRRLRAVLEDLRESVRREHRPAVDAEIARLDATAAAGFAGSVDKDRAQARDRQGIGGPAESTASSRTAST